MCISSDEKLYMMIATTRPSEGIYSAAVSNIIEARVDKKDWQGSNQQSRIT